MQLKNIQLETTIFLFLKSIFIFSGLLISSLTYSQNFEWADCIGGLEFDASQSITLDKNGNVFCTGRFHVTADFDPSQNINNLISFGGSDIYIAKYDYLGNLVWAKNVGGIDEDYSTDIRLDHDGNVLILGYTYGTADLNPSIDTLNIAANSNSNTYCTQFLAKYDSLGNLLWANDIGNGQVNWPYKLEIDTDNNIYVCGASGNGMNFYLFLQKYHSNGDSLWSINNMGGGSYNIVTNLKLDFKNEFLYIGGMFIGTIDFDPSTNTYLLSSDNNSFSNLFMAKYNTAGNFIWAQKVGGGNAGYNQINGIHIDSKENAYLVGYFTGKSDFDPSSALAILTSTGGNTVFKRDVFIAKYDSSGDYLWAKNFGGSGEDIAYSSAMDKSENIFIAGSFTGTADFDPSTNKAILSTNGTRDIFITQYDKDGNYLWAKNLGGNTVAEAYSIVLDSNNIYTSGYFEDNIDLDPSINSANLTSAGNADIFIAKYAVNSLTTSISYEENQASKLRYYYNWEQKQLSISILEESKQKYNLQMVDILGKNVFTQKLNTPTTIINLVEYSSGMYLIKITNDKNESQKEIKLSILN